MNDYAVSLAHGLQMKLDATMFPKSNSSNINALL